MRVLVVDDNHTNRCILDELVRSWGMKPTLAESGPAALVTLQQARELGAAFPLILTDAHMPEMDGFALAAEIRRVPGLSAPTIMMLTSGGYPDDAARCRTLGVAAYLTKPIGQEALLHTLLQAVGSAPAETRTAVAASPSREQRRDTRSILLAEDNVVNQTLALRMLEKRGYSVQVASNGRQVLECLNTQSFDLVLMDVQMPDMDGFEATAAIRKRELDTGKHVPIIAMTAHAMSGDRERCLASGMDGYIAKPIRAKDLIAAVERVSA